MLTLDLEKVFWTRKMNIKLVNFIKKRPYIWNTNHPNYTTSGSERDKTYSEFAKKYGEDLSETAVNDRWTNIRSTFSKYLRKVRSARLDGQSYKVNWYLWVHCQFLLNATKRKSKEENSDTQDPDKDDKMEIQEENFSEQCDTVANNLLSTFQQYQNDAFGCGDSENDEIGRIVSAKLAIMDSKKAAIISVKIMQILCNYECKGTG